MASDIGYQLVERRIELAEAITQRHYELRPELETKYGKSGRKKCVEDTCYHLQYLAEAILASQPLLFSEYVGWVRVMLAGRGVPAADLAENLKVLNAVLKEALGESAHSVLEDYVDAALLHLPKVKAELPSELTEEDRMGKHYLDLLLQGDRRGAYQFILQKIEDGIDLRDLYLHVFQKSQYEMGRLWQMNRVTVAQEHFCTAATQLIMSQLYPQIFSTPKKGQRLVVACVGGDLHELGVRMLADFFEMEGWDTFYLGANTPTDGVIASVKEYDAHILGISATMTFHVQAVANLISTLRNEPACAHVKVMVGGDPFKIDPELWKTVGADGTARDAREAIEVADTLI